jgi:hypothetical protein
MGTSRSSTGPRGGVPLVPPWLEQPDIAGSPPNTPPIAPSQRFPSTKRAISSALRGGDSNAVRSALGGYVRKGYGGAKGAAARMAQAPRTASRAVSILSGLASGTASAQELGFDLAAMRGRSIEDIASAIASAIQPTQITLDDAASRHAVSEALADLVNMDPGIDLLAPSPEQIEEAYILILAYNTFEIFRLDVGENIQAKAKDDFAASDRVLNEIRSTIVEVVRGEIKKIKAQGRGITSAESEGIGREAIAQTTLIFDGWVK